MPRRAIAAIKRRDPLARIGLHVCLGMFLFTSVCAWIWWHVTNAPRAHLTLFFRNTVHGVDIGSPVKIQGVQVGQIEMMGVRLPTANDPEHYAIVRVNLEGELLAEKGLPGNLENRAVLAREIERGLRGRMQLISPITGDLYLELEYKPETPAILVAPDNEGVPEIPTLSDPLSEGILDLTHKFAELEKQDFKRIETELLEKLDRINADLAPETFANLNAGTVIALENLRNALTHSEMQSRIARINADLGTVRSALADMNAGVKDAAVPTETVARLRADLAAAAIEADKIALATNPRSPALLLAAAKMANASVTAAGIRRQCQEIISANALFSGLFQPKTPKTKEPTTGTGAP